MIDANSSSSTPDQLVVTGEFDNTTTSIQFNISNFRNAPSLSSFTNIAISTSTNDITEIIDEATSLSIPLTQAATLDTSSWTISIANSTINVVTDYTFQILIGLPLPTGSSIQITFPSTVTPTSTSPTVTGTQNMNSNINGSYDTSTRVLNMTDISPSGSYVDEGVFIIFVVSSVTNHNTTQTSDGFGYASFDASGSEIEAVTSGATVTATPGTINNASITPTITTIRETTSYTFTFQTSNDAPVGAIIYITFPLTISAANRTSTSCLSSGTNIDTSSALCTVTSNRFLTISNGYPSAGVSNSTSITFSVPSITNYNTIQPSDGFGLQTLTSDNYTIDSLSDNVTVTATVGSLSEYTVTTSSDFTGVQNTFTFSLTVSNEIILINSYFDITLPSEITVDDTSYSEDT